MVTWAYLEAKRGSTNWISIGTNVGVLAGPAFVAAVSPELALSRHQSASDSSPEPLTGVVAHGDHGKPSTPLWTFAPARGPDGVHDGEVGRDLVRD